MTDTKEPQRSQRIDFLDVLRGVAILSVLLVHVEQTAEYVLSKSPGSINGNITYVLSLGKYGVELFFTISGYLLYLIYYVNVRKKISVRGYFDKRVARILPRLVPGNKIAITRDEA